MRRAAETAAVRPRAAVAGPRLANGLVVRQRRIGLHTTRAIAFIDITAAVQRVVHEAHLGAGVAVVTTGHTTTGLLINEHEPLLLEDLTALFERLVPEATPFAHDDPARRVVNLTAHERINGHAHARAALLRASETVPVHEGVLQLGRWQRLFFVEFDGGQRRAVTISLVGQAQRRSRRRGAAAGAPP